jgi:hypothetical protein
MKALEFLHKSFVNVFGEVDGKLITSCVAMTVLLACVLMFYITGQMLPEYMWYSLFALVVVGFGFGTIEALAQLGFLNKNLFAKKKTDEPAEQQPA